MRSEPLAAARAEAVWDLLAAEVRPGPVVEMPTDAAYGYRAADDVASTFDYPPFDRALMDGFAIRCADFTSEPTILQTAGLARAGGPDAGRLEPGSCIQINTGAPIPPGADAVVMVEESRIVADGRVELRGRPAAGQNIERRASLRRRGETLLAAGTRIAAGETAGLISGGVRTVRTYRRPSVALLTTGDELAAGTESLREGQIPESNSFAIRPLVSACGAEVVETQLCPDDEPLLRVAVAEGLKRDVLIVTGGMSKGSHDLVPAMLESLGVRWLVTSLDLKPGKPTRIGRSPRGTWVLGLPGNPVSCVVCFLLFGAAVLRGLQGAAPRPPAYLRGKLETAMPGNGARPMFQPAVWRGDASGELCVRPLDWRGSGDPFGLIGANALLYRPDRVPLAAVGEAIQFLPIDLPL